MQAAGLAPARARASVSGFGPTLSAQSMMSVCTPTTSNSLLPWCDGASNHVVSPQLMASMSGMYPIVTHMRSLERAQMTSSLNRDIMLLWGASGSGMLPGAPPSMSTTSGLLPSVSGLVPAGSLGEMYAGWSSSNLDGGGLVTRSRSREMASRVSESMQQSDVEITYVQRVDASGFVRPSLPKFALSRSALKQCLMRRRGDRSRPIGGVQNSRRGVLKRKLMARVTERLRSSSGLSAATRQALRAYVEGDEQSRGIVESTTERKATGLTEALIGDVAEEIDTRRPHCLADVQVGHRTKCVQRHRP